MNVPTIDFPHRQNLDGEYESICKTCFATVAKAQNETELVAYERAHICDPLWTYRWGQGYYLRAAGPQISEICSSTV
jgi:hypothetical protein